MQVDQIHTKIYIQELENLIPKFNGHKIVDNEEVSVVTLTDQRKTYYTSRQNKIDKFII